MGSSCDIFTVMPALHIVNIIWQEEQEGNPNFSRLMHNTERCFLGCEYPGGVPVLQEAAVCEDMLSQMPERARENVTESEEVAAMTSTPCPMSNMTPTQRESHYWEQVKIIQDAMSEALEPLLMLPDRCKVERGTVSVADPSFETPGIGIYYVMGR